jgi:hypothetical protein
MSFVPPTLGEWEYFGQNTAPKFDIRAELQKAIKQAAGCPYQVDLIRLYIETYGAKE